MKKEFEIKMWMKSAWLAEDLTIGVLYEMVKDMQLTEADYEWESLEEFAERFMREIIEDIFTEE